MCVHTRIALVARHLSRFHNWGPDMNDTAVAAPTLVEASRAALDALKQFHTFYYPGCAGGCPAHEAIVNLEAALQADQGTAAALVVARGKLVEADRVRVAMLDVLKLVDRVLHPGAIGLITHHHGDQRGAEAITAVAKLRAAIQMADPDGTHPEAQRYLIQSTLGGPAMYWNFTSWRAELPDELLTRTEANAELLRLQSVLTHDRTLVVVDVDATPARTGRIGGVSVEDDGAEHEAEPEPDDSYPPRCSNPGGHEFVYTGTAYGGDDESYGGEGRSLCAHCGADGDA